MANSGNPSYFETRAVEYIAEAGMDRLQIQNFPPNEKGLANTYYDQYKHNLIRAIQMLTIAVIKVGDGEV